MIQKMGYYVALPEIKSNSDSRDSCSFYAIIQKNSPASKLFLQHKGRNVYQLFQKDANCLWYLTAVSEFAKDQRSQVSTKVAFHQERREGQAWRIDHIQGSEFKIYLEQPDSPLHGWMLSVCNSSKGD